MSWQATDWVIKNSKHDGGAFTCLLIIASHANEQGQNAYPAISLLAQECRMSERQVQRILPQLEASGELAIVRGHGRGNNHIFRLPLMTGKGDICDIKGDVVTSPFIETVNQEKVTSATLKGDISDIKGDIGARPIIGTRIEPSGNRIQPSIEPSERERHGKRARALPESFTVSDSMKAWAGKDAPRTDLQSETEKFRDYHKARGSVMKDWEAAWRTWIRNAVTFAAKNGNGQGPGPASSAAPNTTKPYVSPAQRAEAEYEAEKRIRAERIAERDRQAANRTVTAPIPRTAVR